MQTKTTYLAVGFVLGVAAVVLAVYLVAPGQMIVTAESQYDFEKTVAALEAAAADADWSSPATLRLDQSLAKAGVDFTPRVAVVELCKPEYAEQVLTDRREMAALMPCRMAVWEGDDGAVYISKMNTGMVAKLFGGTVARVMGGHVAREEHAILSEIVQ